MQILNIPQDRMTQDLQNLPVVFFLYDNRFDDIVV